MEQPWSRIFCADSIAGVARCGTIGPCFGQCGLSFGFGDCFSRYAQVENVTECLIFRLMKVLCPRLMEHCVHLHLDGALRPSVPCVVKAEG